MNGEEVGDMIARLWVAQYPVVLGRFAAIDEGIESIRAGASPSDAVVQVAYREAHNLAGALGSYGRPEGSVLARELMGALAEQGPDPESLSALVARIREACA
ncbi:MAG: hypothetical protein HGA51_08240 [Demequinaceae bacterium]|nr:hypothetical protein [Demequinaceae bacterium]